MICMKAYRGVKLQLHVFLTSATDLSFIPRVFSFKKIIPEYPLNKQLNGPDSRSEYFKETREKKGSFAMLTVLVILFLCVPTFLVNIWQIFMDLLKMCFHITKQTNCETKGDLFEFPMKLQFRVYFYSQKSGKLNFNIPSVRALHHFATWD